MPTICPLVKSPIRRQLQVAPTVHLRLPAAPGLGPRHIVSAMDHAALTSLRRDLPRLQSSSTPSSSHSLESARLAAASLSPSEVLRELRRLSPGAPLVLLVAALGSHKPLDGLRRAALHDAALLHPPRPSEMRRRKRERTHAGGNESAAATTTPALQEHARAIAQLVVEWTPLVAHDPVASRSLEALATAHNVSHLPPPAPTAPSPLDAFRSELTLLSSSLSALHERLSAAASLVVGSDVSEHDGLLEDVTATWASVRARRGDMAQLRSRLTAFAEQADRPQRERLVVGEIAGEVDVLVRGLHERRASLRKNGFEVREVSPGPVEEEESSDDDEWEDAVEVRVEREEVEERALPEVNDWAKVMRGEEGRDVNRMILERFERQARVAANGAGFGEAGSGAFLESDGEGGRGRGRGRGKRRPASTAKDRLSQKLGIKKKRKKKGLLGDD